MEGINLTEILLTPQVLYLAAGIVASLFFIGKIPIGEDSEKKVKLLSNNRWWRRLLPIIPPVIGIIAAFTPGVVDWPREQWGNTIIFGLWTGFVAAHGRKIAKRVVVDKLGDEK